MSYHPKSTLSDNEFLSYAERLVDDLTSTELEIELIRRFKATVGHSEYAAACEGYELKELDEIFKFYDENRALVNDLAELGINDSDDLERYVDVKNEYQERCDVAESHLLIIRTLTNQE